MHVRFSTQHRGGKTYRYVQLVQSYRRPDGMPAHRVVANLGALSDLEVANLKAALAASREGCSVVLPKEAAPKSRRAPMVMANLVYLPLAVLRRIWNDDGLAELVRECLRLHGGDGDVAHVVEALVLQRSVAPGSKLASVEWFRRTALPELMALEPGRYHNTRVHRALEVLDEADADLQERLPSRLRSRTGAFISLFGDVTDTWFEGHGPALACPGIDKEGLYRKRIGIAMLCEQRGFPLRWKTLPGDYQDPKALTELAASLSEAGWAADLPVVMDRSMGRASSVAFLEGTGLRYLTALPVDEFATCGASIPWEPFAALEPMGGEENTARDVAAAAEIARTAGLTRVRDDRWVLDLRVFEKNQSTATAEPTGPSRAVLAVRLAQALQNPTRSTAEVAAQKGMSPRVIRRYRRLWSLDEHLQARVLTGEADSLSVHDLMKIADLPSGDQPAALEDALATKSRRLVPRKNHPEAEPFRVRGVVHFNPERFVEQRLAAAGRCRDLDAIVAQLNEKLGRPGSRATNEVALRTVADFLRRNHLAEVFTARIEPLPDGTRRLLVERDDEAWARLRRFHGFNLFVAHPELPHTAAELVALYFEKDAIEKDFQVIKSALGLRPVRHRTDPKVRAHVTLCVLALLLTRLLEHHIRAAGRRRTAASALNLLSACHLNLADQDGVTFYTVTAPSPDQRDLLTALDLLDLTDDLQVAKLITPR